MQPGGAGISRHEKDASPILLRFAHVATSVRVQHVRVVAVVGLALPVGLWPAASAGRQRIDNANLRSSGTAAPRWRERSTRLRATRVHQADEPHAEIFAIALHQEWFEYDVRPARRRTTAPRSETGGMLGPRIPRSSCSTRCYGSGGWGDLGIITRRRKPYAGQAGVISRRSSRNGRRPFSMIAQADALVAHRTCGYRCGRWPCKGASTFRNRHLAGAHRLNVNHDF